VPLRGDGRRDVQVTVTFKDNPCNLALHLAIKREAAGTERERRNIAAQLVAFDRNNFATRQQAAELVVFTIGVWRGLSAEKRRNQAEKKSSV